MEILIDACMDSLKMLPFLFAAFLVMELLEHYSTDVTVKVLTKVGKAGPVVGALAGCIPQCGFSVLAANLYAGGVLSAGTLISVFIATSDEALLIIMANPGRGKEMLYLLAVKVVIAVLAGYLVDGAAGAYIETEKKVIRQERHGDCCADEHGNGILKEVLLHTLKVFVYLLIFTIILDFCIEVFGIGQLSEFLLGDTIFQPCVAAVVGLIPNCAASVMLTQLYLSGAISFASVIAGLCSGAGIGLVVLFKMNHHRRENIRIVVVLVLIASFVGMLLQLFKI